jgi:hypothetical protein
MSDESETPSRLDGEVDSILGELGLDPEGPISQFTYEVGLRFGTRLVDRVVANEELAFELAEEFLFEFADLFPVDPDLEIEVIQTLIFAPLVSVYLTGRGVSVPQLARMAGVTPESLYRAKRKALSIFWTEEDPPQPVGVNRRYSGRDDRSTLLEFDIEGITRKPWPNPVAEIQPFVQGLMAGLPEGREKPQNRHRVEPLAREIVARLFENPRLEDIFDGAAQAGHRIIQNLRDEVIVMKAQKERATELDGALTWLEGQRDDILRQLRLEAQKIRDWA